jgi:hypothetical protein
MYHVIAIVIFTFVVYLPSMSEGATLNVLYPENRNSLQSLSTKSRLFTLINPASPANAVGESRQWHQWQSSLRIIFLM